MDPNTTSYVCMTLVAGFALFVLWRQSRSLDSALSTAIRAADRTRRDENHIVAQLVEKLTLNPAAAAQIHARERMHESQLDAGLEKSAQETRGKSYTRYEKPAPRDGSLAESMHL